MKKDHFEAVLEYVNDKLDMIIEAIAPLGPMQIKMHEIDERLTRVESDVKVIKKVVTGTNHDLKNHNRRITKLEKDNFGYA